ncbi:integrase core domain-containing protein [Scrofimicrobium canadense]|uniref:integrase core domain-containing protein n=1 Tax=Scrofimicrobium canadense TaxID=2652290 RepID=UPI0012B1CAF5
MQQSQSTQKPAKSSLDKHRSINALAKTAVGLYKTECVKTDRPFRTTDEPEPATLSWMHWFNHDHLHSTIGYRTPIECETNYQHLQNSTQTAIAPG